MEIGGIPWSSNSNVQFNELGEFGGVSFFQTLIFLIMFVLGAMGIILYLTVQRYK